LSQVDRKARETVYFTLNVDETAQCFRLEFDKVKPEATPFVVRMKAFVQSEEIVPVPFKIDSQAIVLNGKDIVPGVLTCPDSDNRLPPGGPVLNAVTNQVVQNIMDKRPYRKYVLAFEFRLYPDIILVEPVLEKVHHLVEFFFDVNFLPYVEDIVTDIGNLSQVIQYVVQLICGFQDICQHLAVLL